MEENLHLGKVEKELEVMDMFLFILLTIHSEIFTIMLENIVL